MNLHNKTAWQIALINAVTDPEELINLLELDKNLLDAARQAASHFMLKVPKSFINRMQKQNIHDPLLRQVLPLGIELQTPNGYSADPLQESSYNPAPGLLHKYHGRVLLTLAGVCAINCRYCFRREFPYKKNTPGLNGWQHALDYVAQDSTINEVILSGGDPLVVHDGTLQTIIDKIADIPHVTRLRFHSRLPVVLPERITQEFVDVITSTRLKTVMVIHCNHAQEINDEVRLAIRMMQDAKVLMLNQSVLLKGVNDNVDTLVALSEALFAANVQPYYLHALDKVRGTAHFDLPRETACELHSAMTGRLPGYLVPKLVCEQPGKPSKSPVYSG